MGKNRTIIAAIMAILIFIGGSMISSYNSIISLEEQVNSAYSEINIQLQRRADLIPNLVSTVKGYAKHEEETFNAVLEAREKVANANSVAELRDADQQLTTALTTLNIIIENYPDLKASSNFTNLQDELAGTENRVSVARKDYNNAVEAYNAKIKKFPSNIMASMMNKEAAEYFEVSDESKTVVPSVNFND